MADVAVLEIKKKILKYNKRYFSELDLLLPIEFSNSLKTTFGYLSNDNGRKLIARKYVFSRKIYDSYFDFKPDYLENSHFTEYDVCIIHEMTHYFCLLKYKSIYHDKDFQNKMKEIIKIDRKYTYHSFPV